MERMDEKNKIKELDNFGINITIISFIDLMKN